MTVRIAAIDLAVLRAITRAADCDEVCPTNNALADIMGAASPAAPVRVLAKLQKSGLIQIERFATSRRVTIVATGKQTRLAGSVSPHWRDRSKQDGSLGALMGGLIRAAAAERGVPVATLCAEAGASASTLSNLERAQAPSPTTIARFLPLLGDRLRAILPPDLAAAACRRHEPPSPPPPSPPPASEPAPAAPATAQPSVCAPANPGAKIPPRPKGRPRTFEEQLAAVAAGARLTTVKPLRAPEPAMTLGGVGSGLL